MSVPNSRSNSPINLVSGKEEEEALEEKLKQEREEISKMMTSLKIPDAVKDLPKYKGDKNGLYDFIQNVEEILSICQPACIKNLPYATIIVRAIRNKIVEDANDVLLMYGTDNVWTQIKHNLITHYADKRDETSLIRDMYRLYQGSETIERFFSRVIDIMNTMNNNAKINIPFDGNRTALLQMKNKLHESMGLSVFLAGLREPMGGMIRAMRPVSLPEALSFCLKEQNIGYIKGRIPDQIKPQLPLRLPIRSPQIGNFQQSTTRPYNPQPQFNYQQFASRPYNPQPQYFNHKPFTNFNNHGNNNRPFVNKPFGKPALPLPRPKVEPMDTTSNQNRYTQPTFYQKNNSQQSNLNRPFPMKPYQFQQSGPPRFRSQELFQMEQQPEESFGNHDKHDYENSPEEYYTEYYSLDRNEPIQEITQENYVPTLDQEVSDEDFHLDASQIQSDT